MEQENNTFLIKDKWNNIFGVLSFDYNTGSFSFEYDEKQKGIVYSDIDVRDGRKFKQDSIFNIFAFDDSWSKNQLLEKYDLLEKTENEVQLFLLNLWADKKELTSKGFLFEKI